MPSLTASRQSTGTDISRMYRTTTQSVAANTFTYISFQVEDLDELGVIDLGSSATQMTISESGDYLVTGSVQFEWLSSAGTQRELTLTRNSDLSVLDYGDVIAQDARGAASGGVTSITISAPVRLVAGDALQAYVRHAHTGSLNLMPENEVTSLTLARFVS